MGPGWYRRCHRGKRLPATRPSAVSGASSWEAQGKSGNSCHALLRPPQGRWWLLRGTPGRGPFRSSICSRKPAAGQGTHLVVGAEAVHLLLEHGHPQVFAQELEDIQLLPEGQRLPGQPWGQWQMLGSGQVRPGRGGEASLVPAGSHATPTSCPAGVGKPRRDRLSPLAQGLAHAEAHALQRQQVHLLFLEGQGGGSGARPPPVGAIQYSGRKGTSPLRHRIAWPGLAQACGVAGWCCLSVDPSALRVSSPLLQEKLGRFPTLSLTCAPALS